MQIKKLDWDSVFFGYPVGRLDLDSNNLLNLKEFVDQSAGFKLIYILSKTALKDLPKSCQLVDKKATFKRKTSKTEIPGDVANLKSYVGSITNELIGLTLQSGVYSRFRTDKNFKNNEYERLYTKWITESVNKNYAFNVLVYEADKTLLGFVTLGEKNGIADIGLVAVSEQARGKRIGTLLVKYAIHESYTLGYQEIQVVTQMENVAAIKLYKNTGFTLYDLRFVYHYWNV